MDGTQGDSTPVETTTTSTVPVQVTNAFSLVACIAVLVSYFLFRHKNKRIMERPSLILAVSMAAADGLLHCINEFGYTDLPHNFICSFFGGFLYAFPTLISIFYSFCIALNTMLVFVFSKRPGNSTLKYYIGIPIALSATICIPALGAGVYGYDATYDLCWIASDGQSTNQVVTRYLFTFGLWCLFTMAFLIIAAIAIIHSVFAKSSKLNQFASGLSKSLPTTSPMNTGANPRPFTQYSTCTSAQEVAHTQPQLEVPSLKSEFESEPPSPAVPVPNRFQKAINAIGSGPASGRPKNDTLSRRSIAMRALAFRLLGYILIPTVCILPGVIIDLITKVSPDTAANIPDSLSTLFDTLNGLVGLFNAILYAMDPALLALYHQIRIARREKALAKNGDVEMTASGSRNARPEATVYTTPPESPTLDTPDGFGFGDSKGDVEGENSIYSQATSNPGGMENETKVEVREGKFLSPIRIGKVKKSERGLPTPRTPVNGNGSGIIIRVDVQVDDDQDLELARLERYLGGL